MQLRAAHGWLATPRLRCRMAKRRRRLNYAQNDGRRTSRAEAWLCFIAGGSILCGSDGIGRRHERGAAAGGKAAERERPMPVR